MYETLVANFFAPASRVDFGDAPSRYVQPRSCHTTVQPSFGYRPQIKTSQDLRTGSSACCSECVLVNLQHLSYTYVIRLALITAEARFDWHLRRLPITIPREDDFLRHGCVMIHTRLSLILATFGAAFALGGCPGDSAPEAPPSDVDLAFDRLMDTPYEPPVPGCRADSASAIFPVLRLADRAGFEYYLSSPTVVASWGIDYDVYPLTRATGTRVDFLHDSESTIASITGTETCPSTIPGTSLTVPSSTHDVVHARIAITSELDAERFADVYFLSGGTRTLTVDTSAALTASAAPSSWFVAFVPTWGNPRAIFTRVPSPGVDVVMDGIPNGPGYVALVRTDLIEEGPAPGTLVAPYGFAEMWSSAAKQFFLAALPSAFGNPTVAPALGVDHSTAWQRLEFSDPGAWTASRPNSLVTFGNGPSTRAVPLPCGSSVVATYFGLGAVTVTAGTGAPQVVREGAPVTFVTPCTAGATSTMGTATGLTGEPTRGLLLVVGGVQ